MTVDNKPVGKSHIRLRVESDNWALLFDPDTGNHRVINPIGVFVWKLLDGNPNLKGIVKEVGDSYNNVPQDVITKNPNPTAKMMSWRVSVVGMAPGKRKMTQIVTTVEQVDP